MSLLFPAPERPTPLVTCIVPNYNGAGHLPETIESLLGQTYPCREIVVVDDGSTDDSVHALSAYSDRITIVEQRNAGVSAARNVGAHLARGDLLCFCDSDDIWLPQKLERQVDYLSLHPRALAVHTDFEPFGDNQTAVDNFQRWRRGPFRSQQNILLANRMIVSSVMVRRWAFVQAGGFRSGVFYPADWLMWSALAELGDIGFLDEALVRYRMHSGSTTVNMRLQHAVEGLAARVFLQTLMASKVAAGDRRAQGDLGRLILDDLAIIECRSAPDAECDHEVKSFVIRLLAGFSLRTYLRALPLVIRGYFRQKVLAKRPVDGPKRTGEDISESAKVF